MFFLFTELEWAWPALIASAEDYFRHVLDKDTWINFELDSSCVSLVALTEIQSGKKQGRVSHITNILLSGKSLSFLAPRKWTGSSEL